MKTEAKSYRNREIDRLRGLAVLFVIWHHLGITILSPVIRPQWVRTWTGVDLFFVISGYVVSASFLRIGEQAAKAPVMPSKFQIWGLFVKRRFIRILPMAWLWALIPLGMAAIFPGFTNESLNDIFHEAMAAFAFIYNYYCNFLQQNYIAYYWSLAVEEHFYVLLPPLLLFVPKSRQIIVCALLIAFVGLGRTFFFNPHDAPAAFFHFLSHNRFDSLFAGVFLILARRPLGDFLGKINVGSWVITFGCYVLCAFLAAFVATELVPINGELALFALASALLVNAAACDKNYVLNIPFFRGPLEEMGVRSFSLYLIHTPAIHLARYAAFHICRGHEAVLENPLDYVSLQIALFLLFVYVATRLNFNWVETPLVRKSQAVRFESRVSVSTA